jgi:glycosyltransferase involved in cell wall biosynthesis
LLERLRQVPGCEPLGFVRDLDAAYREAHLCVVPLRSGGGSNIKLPEACTHGRPVVAFRYAHHAWSDWLQEGHDLRVADDNAGFARHCVALLSDRSELDTLAKSGQARVQQALTFAGFRSMLQNALTG